MRQFAILASVLVLFSACTHYEEDKAAVTAQAKQDASDIQTNYEKNGKRIANTMRDNIKRTGEKIREWWIQPLPEKKTLAIGSSYCYTAYQDVLCYRQPMPGWEHRLVGYQGTNAAPPPPATMKLLPVQAVDEKQLPQNRVANAAPVFSGMPEESKDKEAEPLAAGEAPPAEAAHETLPDPALAPQL